MELRQGDRIRWTRNDVSLGLVNSQTADVSRVKNGTVTFRLEDGRALELSEGDSQLRHIDRAWASTVHAFQGRTVDTVIAAMEANHPHLTTQKTLYVEISRARERAELVTDNRDTLRERLEQASGSRRSKRSSPLVSNRPRRRRWSKANTRESPIGSGGRVQSRQLSTKRPARRRGWSCKKVAGMDQGRALVRLIGEGRSVVRAIRNGRSSIG